MRDIGDIVPEIVKITSLWFINGQRIQWMISQQRFLNHRDVTSTPVSQITGNSNVCLVTLKKISKPVLLALCDWNSPLTRGSLTFPCNDDITQMEKENDINRVGKAKDIYFLTINGGSNRHQIHTHRTPHTKNPPYIQTSSWELMTSLLAHDDEVSRVPWCIPALSLYAGGRTDGRTRCNR